MTRAELEARIQKLMDLRRRSRDEEVAQLRERLHIERFDHAAEGPPRAINYEIRDNGQRVHLQPGPANEETGV